MELPTQARKLLAQLADLWRGQVKICREAKERDFNKSAREIAAYMGRGFQVVELDGSAAEDNPFAHVQAENEQAVEGGFLARRNLAADFLAAMLPYVYHKDPDRLVDPDAPLVSNTLLEALPQLQEWQNRAQQRDRVLVPLMQWFLEWLPRQYGLYNEGLLAVQEALVKGRGMLWGQLWESPFGKLPGSFYDSVDRLLIDSDSKTWREAGFIIHERWAPVYRIADIFELDRQKLRGMWSSGAQQAAMKAKWGGNRPVGDTTQSDMACYYEVWSRIGPGHKLLGAPQEWEEVMEVLDGAGDHCYLAIMDGVDFPLNIDPDKLVLKSEGEARSAEFLSSLEWPIKTYENRQNPWPCARLDFLPDTESPWARPPLESSKPLLKFLDHIYSFVLQSCRDGSRTIIVTNAALDSAVKDALEKGLHNVIIDLAGTAPVGSELKKLVDFIQFPPMHADLWRVIPLAENAFREASGMTPELFGAQPDSVDRSATATNAREGHLVSKPNYFAGCVETFMSEVAAMEGCMTRQLDPATIALIYNDGTLIDPVTRGFKVDDTTAGQPVIGPLVDAWIQYVHTTDPAVAASQISYTVKAGTGRPRNRQGKLQVVGEAMRLFIQQNFQYGVTTGNFGPYRALQRMYGEAVEEPLDDALLPDLPPPPQPPQLKRPGAPPPLPMMQGV